MYLFNEFFKLILILYIIFIKLLFYSNKYYYY